jgi:hypothetical protein
VAKKSAEPDRKAKIEQIRKSQQGAERRRTMLVVGSAIAVIVVLAGIVTKVVLDETAKQDVTKIGVAAAAASCDAQVTDKAPASGSAVHVGPGTEKADITTVKYDTVPPSNGEHFATPAFPNNAFYTAADRPAIENLVHNLEHGYTILWYTSATPKAQVDELDRLSTLLRKTPETAQGKFIAAAWDETRGAFPAGKTVALSHWGASAGARQFCGALSGEAVQAFVKKNPYTDSPEPNAQ